MKQNSFSSCRSCDFQFHFLALHLFRAIDSCNVESQASTLCLKFFLQCCISVEPVSQIAKVSHDLFPCDNLKATICRLPLHEFAMTTGFGCSPSPPFESVLRLSGFSSLCNRRLWCLPHPFLPQQFCIVQFDDRNRNRKSTGCISSLIRTVQPDSCF